MLQLNLNPGSSTRVDGKSMFRGLILVASAMGHAVELNGANFDAEVFESGKNAFVKFLAPW